MPLTIAQALQQATEKLKPTSDTARLDAEVLLVHVLKKDRVHFLTWPEEPLSQVTQESYQALVARRAGGEPIAYITGYQEFWSLKLRVTPDTLIPRPETEVLVEEALTLLREDTHYEIADLGTGSGAIALAIASERPQCHVLGLDQSAQAVQIASENARRLGLDNVSFRQGDWLSGVADNSLDMIVTNPPYVAEHDPHMQKGDVRFEPASALLAGSDGLDAYRRILPEARRCLKPGGGLLLEHGYDQQDRLLALLQQQGFIQTRGIRDYAGLPRVVVGRV